MKPYIIAALMCATTALAAEEPPEVYLGASVGGHFVSTDWSAGELDAISRPVSPRSSLISALRLGVDLTPRWAIEASAAHLPFGASAETNDGLDFAARARWTFTKVALAPFLMLGAGAYVNPQPDPDGTPSDVGLQVHYGVGLGPRLSDHVRLRLDIRHQLAEAIGDDWPTANNIVAMGGLDVFLGGGDAPPPPSDRDGDGLLDGADACPDDAEDLDGIVDEDGCPEDDADGDGIADTADRCPLEPEDKDGIADTDGCPEDDADDDGIADALDRCPADPEAVNGFEDVDGCPDTPPAPAAPPPPAVTVTCAAIEFDELVFFEVAQHRLRTQLRPLLDEIARTMKARPDVKRVRVTGFADATGPAAYNDQLSRQRAWAVREALIERGVGKSRLSVVARGESAPRAPNATAEGRAQNRRVEFTIIEADPTAECPRDQE